MSFEIDTGVRGLLIVQQPEPYEKVSYSFQGAWCRHLQRMVLRKHHGNGVRFREFCVCCLQGYPYGEVGVGEKKARAIWGDIRVDSALDYDAVESLLPQVRLSMFGDVVFRIRYAEHLRSKKWADTRREVFALSGGKCERCGAGAAHVHHKTYANLGAEYLDDLEALCRECHFEEHGRMF